jgi:hypothetical protein
MLLDELSASSGDLQLQSLAHGIILLELLPFEYGRARWRLRVVEFHGRPAIEGFHDFRNPPRRTSGVSTTRDSPDPSPMGADLAADRAGSEVTR